MKSLFDFVASVIPSNSLPRLKGKAMTETITRRVAKSVRLSFSQRNVTEGIKVESANLTIENSGRMHSITPEKVFDGNNIDTALSTNFERFAYGKGAIVATIAVDEEAPDNIKASAIKALEAAMLEQAKSSNQPDTLSIIEGLLSVKREYPL